MEMKKFLCSKCQNVIEVPYGVPKPETCPYCGAPATFIHRIDGGGRGLGRGRGARCGLRMMGRDE
ncbi:conserved hypothetical protein [Methanocaldococcus vulcanius M7]|uniref:Rubredoxin-like domain-containing protein n=1 Tax=Methanocaldococcus vulcanius (strain ATCC 700851 / DSM 12094 / M7) TaxID=579137 RepID=C9RI87_METVM|nr:hypothetical protein [Methanocaldococcus vulcanius]ACX73289.1 conserved hypothetical protein [Methanocaldococcus vulcanius M7]